MRAIVTAFVTLTLALLIACFPSKDEIVGECQLAADEAAMETWEACTDYYEETVLPVLQLAIERLEDTIERECRP